jgi:hypothetical protein
MKIGTVEIPIVYTIERVGSASVDEIDNLTTGKVVNKHESQIQTITIAGFANEHIHSQQTPLDQQVSEIKGLRDNSADQNSIDYRDYKGHLMVEEVTFSDNSDSKIVKDFEIIAKYLPWPKYYSGSEP